MSRFVRSIGTYRYRAYSDSGSKTSKVFDIESVQAYLQSVCDPTGKYHPELFESVNSDSNDVTIDPVMEEKLNDYLSDMSESHSRSKNRS